jgi:quercetin dioxygenase-like cupin family protein
MMNDPAGESDEPAGADAADRDLIRRTRRRVLERIALDSVAQHLTVRAGPEDWQPFLPGVRCKVLNEHANAVSYLLQIEPGAVLPAHRHSQDEECLVLQGQLRIGDQLVIGAGDYHLGRAGVLHAAATTDTGALVFLRGAAPDGSESI